MHHNHPNEPERRTIKRHTDEPRLEVGTTIEIKAGVIGVVVARYTPSGGRNEVHYIVEVRPGKTGAARPRVERRKFPCCRFAESFVRSTSANRHSRRCKPQ